MNSRFKLEEKKNSENFKSVQLRFYGPKKTKEKRVKKKINSPRDT